MALSHKSQVTLGGPWHRTGLAQLSLSPTTLWGHIPRPFPWDGRTLHESDPAESLAGQVEALGITPGYFGMGIRSWLAPGFVGTWLSSCPCPMSLKHQP